jgi:hypothetical protein
MLVLRQVLHKRDWCPLFLFDSQSNYVLIKQNWSEQLISNNERRIQIPIAHNFNVTSQILKRFFYPKKFVLILLSEWKWPLSRFRFSSSPSSLSRIKCIDAMWPHSKSRWLPSNFYPPFVFLLEIWFLSLWQICSFFDQLHIK